MNITISDKIPLVSLVHALSNIGCELVPVDDKPQKFGLHIRPSQRIYDNRYDLQAFLALPAEAIDTVCWTITYMDREWLRTVMRDWFGTQGGTIHQVIARLRTLQSERTIKATQANLQAFAESVSRETAL